MGGNMIEEKRRLRTLSFGVKFRNFGLWKDRAMVDVHQYVYCVRTEVLRIRIRRGLSTLLVSIDGPCESLTSG